MGATTVDCSLRKKHVATSAKQLKSNFHIIEHGVYGKHFEPGMTHPSQQEERGSVATALGCQHFPSTKNTPKPSSNMASKQNKKNRRKRIRNRVKLKTGNVHKAITPAQKAEYYRYLKSAQWKEKRRVSLDFYGNRCGLCGNKYDLEIHHRSYRTIFKEAMEDLMILCETCHTRHHKAEVWKNGRKSKYMRDPQYDTAPITYYPDRKII